MQTATDPLPVAATSGSRIVLEDGRVLIDGIASWWTACHGYNHPHIAAAVRAQLAVMPHVMFGGLAHEPAYTLAARLAALLPETPHVFFSDSGSVGVEVAMKMALQYWMNRKQPEKRRFVSFLGGYHGDTLGAMSVCDPDEGMHALFGAVLTKQDVLPLPSDAESHAALRRHLRDYAPSIAGMIVEPLVQGAGGMRFHAPETLRRLRALADAFDLPLILDEVFTGFGRTGALFACRAAAVAPDIIVLSKALTAGTMGLAATLASARIHDAFLSDRAEAALMHGPTYMANPLACAAANASLDLFETIPWRDNVEAIGEHLRAELAPCRAAHGVRDVRVLGAIGVVEFDRAPDLAALKTRLTELGVWVRPFGRTLYITPALNIGEADLAALTKAVATVVGERRMIQ
jgi:adenosylmethionine-8-amino-7-oxononanoate aminotransferase